MSDPQTYSRADELIDMASNNDGVVVIECASSFVRFIGYDMISHRCKIGLDYKGRTYEYNYFDMSFDFFVEFVDSGSKGEFYNEKIKKGNYPKHSTE